MAADPLTPRALNRATLARQLLLERVDMSPLDAVTHLVGLQAQVPLNPYTALWSRLRDFDPAELSRLIEDRALVRIVVMRGTIHLVTAADCFAIRPLIQPVLDQELARHSEHASHLRELDLDPVLAFAGPLLAERALSGTQLREALATRFPELDAPALAYACRNKLACVQVPPRGLWGRAGQVKLMLAEAWLDGREQPPPVALDALVLRYFAAFGPATVADVSTWTRLTGLREVVERLRPQLHTFADDRGRELFDVDHAPRPDADVPAPPRFLPEYDNVLLSHADRTRFARDDDARKQLYAVERRVEGTVLYDGHVVATWAKAKPVLAIHHLPLTRTATAAIEDEARRFLAFSEPDTDYDVRFTEAPAS